MIERPSARALMRSSFASALEISRDFVDRNRLPKLDYLGAKMEMRRTLLRDLVVVRGMKPTEAVDIVREFEDAELELTKEAACLHVAMTQYPDVHRSDLPTHWREGLTAEERDCGIALDKKLFEHDQAAARAKSDGCHCDLCKKWMGDLDALDQLGRKRSNRNRQQRRKTRR